MTMFNEFWDTVSAGLRGKNKGIPVGLPRIEKYLNGIHRGRYYTVFSEGGTGKSSFVWSTFVINTLDYMVAYNKALKSNPKLTEAQKADKKISVKVKLYSLEVVRREAIAKMVCFKIYKDYGLIVSVDYLLNRVEKYNVSSVIVHLAKTYKKYFEWLEAEGYLEIIDTPRTPSQIKMETERFSKKHGKYLKNTKGETYYVADNPNEFVIIITDTVGNLSLESATNSASTKTTIDLHSANCRYIYRDLLDYIPINISHSNRSMGDTNRAKMGEVFPKLSDIKETGMLEQDSSVVLTIFSPMNHISSNKSLETFMNYDIKLMKDRFRCLGILKNRHGGVNKRVGLLFIGENGAFRELPRVDELTNLFYQSVLNLQEVMYKPVTELLSTIAKKNPVFAKELTDTLIPVDAKGKTSKLDIKEENKEVNGKETKDTEKPKDTNPPNNPSEEAK